MNNSQQSAGPRFLQYCPTWTPLAYPSFPSSFTIYNLQFTTLREHLPLTIFPSSFILNAIEQSSQIHHSPFTLTHHPSPNKRRRNIDLSSNTIRPQSGHNGVFLGQRMGESRTVFRRLMHGKRDQLLMRMGPPPLAHFASHPSYWKNQFFYFHSSFFCSR